MSNPFSGQLLNPDDAIRSKPHVDVKPRPVEMVTPYHSQIDAPTSNYVAPSDRRPQVTHEISSAPSASQVTAPTGNHQQPDVEAKALASEPGAKPFYLKLKPDELGPASNPTSKYIPSGSNATDPTAQLSLPLCPADGSVMRPVGSTRLAWVCVAYGHQWDVTNGMATPTVIYVADEKLRPALPNALPSL